MNEIWACPSHSIVSTNSSKDQEVAVQTNSSRLCLPQYIYIYIYMQRDVLITGLGNYVLKYSDFFPPLYLGI